MKPSVADSLAREMFDPDVPNVVEVELADGSTFYGSFTREYVETDEIVGVRSVLTAPSADVEGLTTGDSITVAGTVYKARVIQVRGRAITGVILGTG